MNFWKSKSKSFTVSERDPTHKVRYLGNVQTTMMKGEGCVDKPVKILWDNFVKNAPTGVEMKLTICGAGLKVHTKLQGLTEYRAHRISYCVAHPRYPKLFVWVYRHEGKKMKVELRCHAVLCKTEEKAKAMAVLLHDKLQLALSEFLREKTRSQNSRLALQRTNSMPSMGFTGVPLRKKMLSTAQNFKPSVEKSPGAPKLGAISEDLEPEIVEEDEDGEEEEEDASLFQEAHETRHRRRRSRDDSGLNFINVEIGNDIEELKNNEKVQQYLANQDSEEDEDGSSTESGFSEREMREPEADEARETGSAGSGSWTDSGIGAEQEDRLFGEVDTEDQGSDSPDSDRTISCSPSPLQTDAAFVAPAACYEDGVDDSAAPTQSVFAEPKGASGDNSHALCAY